jgi:hypothetical protein
MIAVESAISTLVFGEMVDGTDYPIDTSLVLYTNRNMLRL